MDGPLAASTCQSGALANHQEQGAIHERLGTVATAIVKSRMTGLADEYFSMAATGIAVMFAALLLQLIWPGRVYVLILRTSGGDVDAVTSRNKEFVSNLQKAVEQAFFIRARQPPVSETGSSQ